MSRYRRAVRAADDWSCPELGSIRQAIFKARSIRSAKAFGVKPPRAMWGRLVLQSILHSSIRCRASAIEMTFRHSARRRPLVEHLTSELGAVVDPNASRLAADLCEPIQFFDCLVRSEDCPRTCRESFSRMAVDHRQDSKRPSVEQPLGDEVHRPGVVGTTDCRSPHPIPAISASAGRFVRIDWPSSQYTGRSACGSSTSPPEAAARRGADCRTAPARPKAPSAASAAPFGDPGSIGAGKPTLPSR